MGPALPVVDTSFEEICHRRWLRMQAVDDEKLMGWPSRLQVESWPDRNGVSIGYCGWPQEKELVNGE